MELILNSTEFLFNSTEISECFKKGLLCPNKTTCAKTGNESYDCVCNKGFHMVHGLNYTCEGEIFTTDLCGEAPHERDTFFRLWVSIKG